MLDFYCWLDLRSLPLDFLTGCQIVQDYVKYHDPLWYLSWNCPCLFLVVTNLNFCSSNATRASDPRKSRFRPFSEFLDRYWVGEQIAQYAIQLGWVRCRTPYSRIIEIVDQFTNENLCAKVITKQFCNPSGILVLDPDLLTSIRHKNIIEYRDIYESEEELIVTIER